MDIYTVCIQLINRSNKTSTQQMITFIYKRIKDSDKHLVSCHCAEISQTNARTGRVLSHPENLIYIHWFCRVCPVLWVNNYTCVCRRCPGCITLTFSFPPCRCAWLSPRPIYPVPVVEASELKSNIPRLTITHLLLTLTKPVSVLRGRNEKRQHPCSRKWNSLSAVINCAVHAYLSN